VEVGGALGGDNRVEVGGAVRGDNRVEVGGAVRGAVRGGVSGEMGEAAGGVGGASVAESPAEVEITSEGLCDPVLGTGGPKPNRRSGRNSAGAVDPEGSDPLGMAGGVESAGAGSPFEGPTIAGPSEDGGLASGVGSGGCAGAG
jgi:hypothetical protein